ncbi:MAG: N-acetyltransferase [Alphaproteobacteria bacterium]|nr:N-acetyltransferase [Alphaproteobacteria bacterium]
MEEIVVRDNPGAGRFEVRIGDQLAVALYQVTPRGIRFTHTEVPKELGGRGIATALVRTGLAEARRRGLKVLPDCPFFARYIKEHPEEQDILHQDYRARLGL